MKKAIFYLLSISFYCYSEVYLEYGKSWGRFGDNLLSYMHTKYVSYLTGIPVLYSPFIYSDQLKLSEEEVRLNISKASKIEINDKLIEDNFQGLADLKSSKGLVVEIPYFPEDLYEYKTYKHINPKWHYFQVNWQDPVFKQILKEHVAPKKAHNLLKIPDDKISIAIHVREGGGFDDADAFLNNPLKFPPLEYYVTALHEILVSLGTNKEYYVYIFTDHQRPKELLEYFRKHFPQATIQFDGRIHNNRHDQNVLEDFFSLTLFDCLIRSQSNFSLLAAKIADYKIEIEPVEFEIKDKKVTITKANKIYYKI